MNGALDASTEQVTLEPVTSSLKKRKTGAPWPFNVLPELKLFAKVFLLFAADLFCKLETENAEANYDKITKCFADGSAKHKVMLRRFSGNQRCSVTYLTDRTTMMILETHRALKDSSSASSS